MKDSLRIIAKKNRSQIFLDLKSNINFNNKINLCLDQIFLNQHDIRTAGLYCSINNEVSSFRLINYLISKNIILSMPVVDIKKKCMCFKKWNPRDKLKKGPLGNLEPLNEKETILPQILVVPILMFDRELYRLGYGGGYYDKSIYQLKKSFKKEKRSFIAIGLAYSLQETKRIPYESHDMYLDYIITEKELLSKKH